MLGFSFILFKLYFQKNIHLTIYIIRVTLNTEIITACLCGRHSQMTHFGVYPLVCPFSIWLRQGFYVELFSINAFAPDHQAKMKRTFSRIEVG